MFFRKTVRVFIKNKNITLEVKSGTNLYDLLVSENIIYPELCKGSGQCGKCKVHITQKNQPKPSKRERLVLARINLDFGYRLACQTSIKQDMVIDTSELSYPSIDADNLYFKEDNVEKSTVMPKGASQVIEKTLVEALQDIPAVADDMTITKKTVAVEKAINDSMNLADEDSAASIDQMDTPIDLKKLDKNNTIAEEISDKLDDYTRLDGLLVYQSGKNLQYFLYSAALDGIAQEGTIEYSGILRDYVAAGMLTDYVHDVLQIRDIDRIIVISDEVATDGENLFDAVYYTPFDIGATPCEYVCPMDKSGAELFLRLINSKGEKRVLLSLDNLDKIYHIDDGTVTRIPSDVPFSITNIFTLVKEGDNPIVEISDDLKRVKAKKQYESPDSLTFFSLLKIISIMVTYKIVDNKLNIINRSNLNSSIPLDMIVKVVSDGDVNAFYVHRDRDSGLLLKQDALTKINHLRQNIYNAIDFANNNFGGVQAVSIITPVKSPGIVDLLVKLGFIPEKNAPFTTSYVGDNPVTALKLFQDQSIRLFVQKNIGSYIRAD